jgi:hypothetical protein
MFDWVPNPMDWLGGDDRASVPQGPDRWAESQQVTGPEPASIRDRYRSRAFNQVGAANEEEFNNMDPRQRNTRLTGAYADMYMSDTDTMKWAGMAAYASDLVGIGIAGTEVAGGIPLLPEGMDTAGIDNAELNRLLAVGNAGVYDDLMWQHMAMQEGGIEMMRAAAEAGEIPKEQMAGWETIAAGRTALDEARASGDEEAIAAANETVWAGNNALLQYEQQVFLQNLVYDDSPAARELFDRISPGMVSPIPGGTSFVNHRDARGQDIGGGADVGDADQRWEWIRDSMAPEYRNREENEHDSMMRDMRRFSANADTGLPGLPVNTEDPLDFEMPGMPDIPYLPMLLREGGEMIDGAVDWIDSTRVGHDLLSAGRRVGSDLSAAGSRVWNDVSPYVNQGLDMAGDAASWVGDRAGDVWDAASPYVNRGLDAAGDAASWVGDRAGEAWDAASPYVNRGLDAAGDAASWVGDQASDAWNTVSDFASPYVNQGLDMAGDAANWVGDRAGDVWNAASPYVDRGLDMAGDAASWVGDQASDAWNTVSDAASPYVDRGVEMASDAASWVGNQASDAWNTVSDAASPYVDRGVEMAGRAWDATTETASNAWNTVSDAAAPYVDRGLDMAGDAANWVGNQADRAYTATTSAISSGYDTVTSGVSSAYDSVTDW